MDHNSCNYMSPFIPMMQKTSLVFILLCLKLWMLEYASASLLEDAEKSDTSAVRLRLEEEKEKRILLNNDVEVLMLKVARLERLVTQVLQNIPEGLHRNTSATPAFMAFMSKSFVCSANQRAVFDDVRLNVGNYYNGHRGVFQAPVSGTYHFALTLSTDNQSGNDFHAYIVAGDGNKVLGYVFQDPTKDFWQARTVSVLAYLESGEDVWIKCTHNSEIAGGLHSCFSGFLVDSR